jgi:hypothetical protein
MRSGLEFSGLSSFEESCITSIGRNLLLWQTDDGGRVLRFYDPVRGDSVWPPRKFSAAAHVCLVDSEAVGVMEPDGHLVVLSLPDGQTMIDTMLQPEKNLAEIILQQSGDQFFLIVHSAPRRETKTQPLQAISGCNTRPIGFGRLYAFDHQGKMQWANPVTIENQHFLLNQPCHLPVLTFACQVYNQQLVGQGKMLVKILCVDKRNGQVAYKGELPNPTGVFVVTGEPEKKTVSLHLQRNNMILAFTDKPLPASANAEGAPAGKEKAATVPKALLRSLERALGHIGGESAEPESSGQEPSEKQPELEVPLQQKQ